MRQLYLVKFICLAFLVKFSQQHAEAIAAGTSCAAGEAGAVVAAGAAAATGCATEAAVATNVAGRRGLSVGVDHIRDTSNQKILAAGVRKAADDILIATNAAAATVLSSADTNKEAIDKAVARLGAVIHDTGDVLLIDGTTFNAQIIENVKLTAGKAVTDLGVTLATVQKLINEEVIGIDTIVSSAVARVLKNIQEGTSIIATSTHAALQATKNNVITAARAVSVDVSTAGRDVLKTTAAARANIQKSILASSGSLQIGASLLGKLHG